MASKQKLALQVKALLWEKGQKALEQANQTVTQEKVGSSQIQAALEYFMSSWQDVGHSALLALACEAVGGKPESTQQIAVAYVLLSGGADIHDDIIDESLFKYSKPTVLGKFGKDIAILAGDALLFKGFMTLYKACEALPENQKQKVIKLTQDAFFKISTAEEKESSLKGKFDASVANDFLDLVELKAAVGEISGEIGAIVGGATLEEAEALGHFGKTLGALLTIRDEFIDVFDFAELRNRAENEFLPLPILLTLKDATKTDELKNLFKGRLTRVKQKRVVELVINSKETSELKRQMREMVKDEMRRLGAYNLRSTTFTLLLKSTLEDL
jgi:geranylgeranyl pyrophosphate synthase